MKLACACYEEKLNISIENVKRKIGDGILPQQYHLLRSLKSFRHHFK